MENRKKPMVKIQLPNLLLIPLMSVVFSIIKLFGEVEYGWIVTIFVLPPVIYFCFSLGVLILAIATIFLARMVSGRGE